MHWSKLKQSIEARFAPSVKGRVRIQMTRFHKAPDQESAGAIIVDGKKIIDFSYYNFYREQYYARLAGGDRDEVSRALAEQDIHSSDDLWGALGSLLNLSIEDALNSPRPLIRAIGMLDARLGKRRLRNIDCSNDTELVQRLWQLRCQAENLTIPNVGTKQVELPGAPIKSHVFSSAHMAANPKPPDSARAAVLSLDSRTRKIQKLLHNLQTGAVNKTDINSPVTKLICQNYADAIDPSGFCEALATLASISTIADETAGALALAEVARDHSNWQRSLDSWEANSHNSQKQLASLLRHLYAKFDVPRFMDQAWTRPNRQYQEWYRHVGRGDNIRSAEGLPVVLTKKMAHHFLQAPEHYPINAAIRWGQVHALGGDQSLCDALLDARLVEDFADDHFWLSVLKFLVRNPMLDRTWVNPILDFIWSQKYEDRLVFVAEGVVQNQGPVQPNFSMHGRTVDALLRQMQGWHNLLSLAPNDRFVGWPKSSFPDWQFVEGQKETANMRIYRIRELLSVAELREEGSALKHCVASYAQSCQKRVASVWSLSVESEAETKRLVTIEVVLADSRIRQVRGLHNRFMNAREREIIQRWSSQAGLILSDYI